MGRESDDIDIALDNIYGHDFAQKISEHLSLAANKVNYGVIKANTDKSKHLETAAIKVHGIDIDLVNLRAEEYTT
jgi:tRNA nucleotidyltransferase (CCA-adding enzyme)